MAIDIKTIQQLRSQTGAGIADVKEALEASGGDVDAAIKELKKKGAKAAAKRADRTTSEGVVSPYIHSNGKLGTLVALGCETDFVARNEDFQELGKDIAMHVAAIQPEYVSSNEIPSDILENKKSEISEELKSEGKPEDMIEKIVEGKLNKWYEDICLLNQKFVKNEDITIQQLIEEKIGTIGEKIEVHGFSIQQI